MGKPMYSSRLSIVGQDTLGNKMCGPCWDGKHSECIHGDCRCLKCFARPPRKRKAKAGEKQADLSEFGTIEV